jgi:nitroreductase
MEIIELIKRRYSVREYRPDPIHPEQLDNLLEVAKLAPTAATGIFRSCGFM